MLTYMAMKMICSFYHLYYLFRLRTMQTLSFIWQVRPICIQRHLSQSFLIRSFQLLPVVFWDPYCWRVWPFFRESILTHKVQWISKFYLSFLELLICGTHCHPLPSLNPAICHLLDLISINLILSSFLLQTFPHFLSFSFAGASW